MPKAKSYKRPRQVAVYAPKPLLGKLQEEAKRRRRKLGPTVLEILREYFKHREEGYPKFADT